MLFTEEPTIKENALHLKMKIYKRNYITHTHIYTERERGGGGGREGGRENRVTNIVKTKALNQTWAIISIVVVFYIVRKRNIKYA